MSDLAVNSFKTANAINNSPEKNTALAAQNLRDFIDEIVGSVTIYDIHTHLFAPQFGALNLWGIDELLNYHYLIAEMFRSSAVRPEHF